MAQSSITVPASHKDSEYVVRAIKALEEGGLEVEVILKPDAVSSVSPQMATDEEIAQLSPGNRLREHKGRVTQSLVRVFLLAVEEARRFNHNYSGSEHLLLGLVRSDDPMTKKVLEALGVELVKVRSSVEFIIGRGDRMVMGEMGLTPRAKKIVELAIDEARRRNHPYIGPIHLLLGVVREGEGIASGSLESLGVSLDKVRAMALREIDIQGLTPKAEYWYRRPSSQIQRGDLVKLGLPEEVARLPFLAGLAEALYLAAQEAKKRQHRGIGVEHVLSGVLQLDHQSYAVQTIEHLGLSVAKVLEKLEPLLNERKHGETHGLTPRAIQVIKNAAIESDRLHKLGLQDSMYIGDEALILGILSEGHSAAAGVFESFLISLVNAREAIEAVLRKNKEATT